jgi:hypothetical protein
MPQLTKREIAWFLDGLGGTGRVIEYRVQGPSPADEAFIANFGSCYHDRWKILRVKDGANADWNGRYATADEAFAALSRS